jgi:hypothetical protein
MLLCTVKLMYSLFITYRAIFVKPSKNHLLVLILSFTYFLSACSSTSVFNNTAQLTDVTSSWLYTNCTDSDWRQSSKLNYTNCSLASSDIRGDAYTCEFSNERARGLFKDSSGLTLLCGVKTKGIENVGVTYTNGTSDTSVLGKALAATAAVAVGALVAAAAANSNNTGYYTPPSTSSCNCPYDTASDGSRCGARSAWSRSGGETPYCSVISLTQEDILNKQ